MTVECFQASLGEKAVSSTSTSVPIMVMTLQPKPLTAAICSCPGSLGRVCDPFSTVCLSGHGELIPGKPIYGSYAGIQEVLGSGVRWAYTAARTSRALCS